MRAGEFILRNRDPDRWKDLKQLDHKQNEDDPLRAFLRRINGNVMRPVEHKPKPIENKQTIAQEAVAEPPKPVRRDRPALPILRQDRDSDGTPPIKLL